MKHIDVTPLVRPQITRPEARRRDDAIVGICACLLIAAVVAAYAAIAG
jgi:hypothetical protein